MTICVLIVFYVINTNVLSNLPTIRTTLAEAAQSQMLYDPVWKELGVYPVIQPCPPEK